MIRTQMAWLNIHAPFDVDFSNSQFSHSGPWKLSSLESLAAKSFLEAPNESKTWKINDTLNSNLEKRPLDLIGWFVE